MDNWSFFINTITKLAQSQGYYGRMLDAINRMSPDDLQELKDEIALQSFKDGVDVIFYVEG